MADNIAELKINGSTYELPVVEGSEEVISPLILVLKILGQPLALSLFWMANRVFFATEGTLLKN